MPSLLPGKREVGVAGAKGVPVVSYSGGSAPRIVYSGHLGEAEKSLKMVSLKLQGLNVLFLQIIATTHFKQKLLRSLECGKQSLTDFQDIRISL